MTEKYRNKYRIPSIRLQNWDYGQNGLYFVTICTKNRERFFGNIQDGKMELSEIGKMANKYWLDIPGHFPFVKLDAFIVMPNHIHGIIIIDKLDNEHNEKTVETQDLASLQEQQSTQQNKFGPQSKNLASIIRGFKIGVTKNTNQINVNFAWQSRFYDHIIRNDKSYQNIFEYIKINPQKWKEDELYNE